MISSIEYVAFDPGKRTGIAFYDSNCHLLSLATVLIDKLTLYLMALDLSRCSHFIVEEYRLYPDKIKQQVYSKVETIQAIGKIKAVAEIREIKVVEQGAKYKRPGYAFQGITPPSDSDTQRHQLDANAHGVFFFVNTGRINPATLIRKGV